MTYRRFSSALWHLLPAAAVILALPACTTVGPDYRGPPIAAPVAMERGHFLREPARAQEGAPVAEWWVSLADPVLTQLVQHGLEGSPNLAMARAKITQARAGLSANRTAVLPTLRSSASAPYANLPADIIDTNPGTDRIDFQRYSQGFDASWEIDLFGGTKRKVEAASALAEAAEAELGDAQVSLSAEIVRLYCLYRAQQALLKLQHEQAAIDGQLIQFAQMRYGQGSGPRQPAEQARLQAARTSGDVAATQAQIVLLADQLAMLTGQEPGTLDAVLASTGAVPLPPAAIALGDPAMMLRQRPDIRGAERALAAANADIGAAMAEQFPKVSFFGLLGLGGTTPADLLAPTDIIGLALPRISWSVFDGGRSEARITASEAAYTEQVAAYRSVVLGALADAEGALTRFGTARTKLGAADQAETSADTIVALQRMRADGGRLSEESVLVARREAIQFASASVQARAEVTIEFAAVHKALGLGWTVETGE